MAVLSGRATVVDLGAYSREKVLDQGAEVVGQGLGAAQLERGRLPRGEQAEASARFAGDEIERQDLLVELAGQRLQLGRVEHGDAQGIARVKARGTPSSTTALLDMRRLASWVAMAIMCPLPRLRTSWVSIVQVSPSRFSSGSSRRRTGLFRAKARLKSTRWRMPTESDDMGI